MRESFYVKLKVVAYWLLNLAGLNAYFRRNHRSKLRIFMLHGVANCAVEHEWLPLRQQLDVQDFERIVRRLSKDYHFITMDDAAKMIMGEIPLVDNAAVMSFDDGYLNNFTQALPVLRRHRVPGVFYCATGAIKSREPFWFDRLDYVLQAASEQGVEFLLAGKRFVFESTERQVMTDKYAELRIHCKKSFPDDMEFTRALDELAQDLEQKTGKSLRAVFENDEWAAVISIDDMAKYSAEDFVTIGGHTISHKRLSFSTEVEITDELSKSKGQIEQWSDRPCLNFSYPNGAYDDVSVELVKAAGYHSAVTSDFGFNAVGDDVFTLRRLSIVVNSSESELLARASGLEEAITSLTSRLKHSSSR